jgi:hypothetical protein
MAVPDGQQALSGTASCTKPGFGRVFYFHSIDGPRRTIRKR